MIFKADRDRLAAAVLASLAIHALSMTVWPHAWRHERAAEPRALEVFLPAETLAPVASIEPRPHAVRNPVHPHAPAATETLVAAARSSSVQRPAAAHAESPPPIPAAPLAPAQVQAPSEERGLDSAATSDALQPILASAPSQAAAQPAVPLTVALAPAPAVEPLSAVLEGELLKRYGQSVTRALERFKQYPLSAQIRGWEGAVVMKLRVAPSGRLLGAQLQASSGHEVLDKQALAMAMMAQQLPPPPEEFRDREIAVQVPIVFRIERESR